MTKLYDDLLAYFVRLSFGLTFSPEDGSRLILKLRELSCSVLTEKVLLHFIYVSHV